VVGVVDETPRTRSLALDLPQWPGHRAGQHVDVRLTAEDGYQAQRSYSIASAPDDDELVLTVERLDDGEVSPYLVDELRTGDQLELRGPIGGYFVWDDVLRGVAVLIAGGSGIVPFRSMLRHAVATESAAAITVLYSARSLEDVIYRDELTRLAAHERIEIRLALTRSWPDGWDGHRGRIDRALLGEIAPPGRAPLVFICGPSGFVEAAAGALVEIGHEPSRIRTERFGASG
jgi:ferredoxin-NADP reductase